jgi:hypothetical protein
MINVALSYQQTDCYMCGMKAEFVASELSLLAKLPIHLLL